MEKLTCGWPHRLIKDTLPKRLALCSSVSPCAKTSSTDAFINLFYGFCALNEYAEKKRKCKWERLQTIFKASGVWEFK